MTNFLQSHYNHARDSGEEHIMYVLYNDLTTETGDKLKAEYEKLRAEIPPRPDLEPADLSESAATAFRKALS